MHLARVQGENFRLFERFHLQPHPRLNLVIGPNACGKTTLLEAIYCLGRGRSFRGLSGAEQAGVQGTGWTVSGSIETGSAPSQRIGVAWSRAGTRLRLGATPAATLVDLIRTLPIQIIDPTAHRLLEDGPGYRRRYLDWGVFHVEQSFFPAWRSYQRALRQRNRALKTASARAEVAAWEPELAAAGEVVHRQREAHLAALRPLLTGYLQRLLGPGGWSLELSRGWNAHKPLAETLREHHDRDRRLGQTLEGPHRAELHMLLEGHPVKHRVSRGQQKLLVAALVLAQCHLIQHATGAPPLLLLDDFPAELGADYQRALLGALTDYPGQVFLSAIDRNEVLKEAGEHGLFRVGEGRVQNADNCDVPRGT